MGDEDEGEPHLLLQGLEQVDHLGLDGDIQRRDRLVADDHLGLQDQRPGDADALALAAGELMGVAVHQVGQKPHLGHHGPHLLLHLLPGESGVEGDERLGDDVADCHAWVQGGQRVLEDHLDLLALLPQRPLLELGQILAQPHHLAVGGRHQTYQGPGEGGLATAGLPHYAQGLPLVEAQGDAIHRLQGGGLGPGPGLVTLDAEVNLEVGHFQQQFLVSTHLVCPLDHGIRNPVAGPCPSVAEGGQDW
ncbi:hypothetical protein D3C84_500870 [compost metagenome]